MSFSQTSVAERCQFSCGDYIDGTWEVDSFLGEGTFGQVFKVKDSKGDYYALKLLKLWEILASERPNLLKRFEREYETGRIQSNYLVHSLHKGIVKGNAYIVMEFCNGGDLYNALKRTKLDLPLLAKHILLGLKDLHLNGKVHRDLKPENVLLRNHNHAVLTDFGISGDQNNRLTQRGWSGIPQQRFGTIAYMPPEQINPQRGNATVLPTTDIFSFGVMMYQLLTGNLPFGELSSEADVPKYVYNGKNGIWDKTRLNNVSNGSVWIPVIEGCLAPDFKDRLQTIDDVLALLPQSVASCSEPRVNQSINTPYKTDICQGILLRIMQGEEFGKTYVLNDLFTDNSTIISIGRANHEVWNHIGLEELESCYISRQHCTIEKDTYNNSWIIRDGQYRIQCDIGLRFHHLFPCPHCSARCPKQVIWNWKESLNGTYVNSQEVDSAGVSLNAGDIISIGDVKMRVEGV